MVKNNCSQLNNCLNDIDNLFDRIKILFLDRTGTRWNIITTIKVVDTGNTTTIRKLIDYGLVERIRHHTNLYTKFKLTEKGEEFFAIILL